MMRCPKCNAQSRVAHSRTSMAQSRRDRIIRRRRLCLNDECGHRWTTYELDRETLAKPEAMAEIIEQATRHERGN